VAAGLVEAIALALGEAGVHPLDVAACGIACQRNTDFAWDAHTGQPVANAITWQDLRTVPLLDELAGWPQAAECRRRLGYAPGPYSSALHLAWRFRHDPAVIAAARDGWLRLGLSGAWLLNALGCPSGHQMDYSLVQATGLYDFRARDYWSEWLDWLGVPRAPLPAAVPTVHEYGTLRVGDARGAEADVPVLAMIGDQQGALFGYDCRQPGDAECTHGTASFVDVCIGDALPEQEKVNVYFGWVLDGATSYCLEADTTVTGAAVRWMRENARLFDRDDELDGLAASVPDSGGVVFVPAFTGLNVPYNDPDARGLLLGLALGSTRAHVARAFLEAIGFQIRAILETMASETSRRVDRLFVGGGLAASDQACQIQADLLGKPIFRPTFTQTTARAAALLAGLGAGAWKDLAGLPPMPEGHRLFEPHWPADRRDAAYRRWQKAIHAARTWEDDTL
jgi:glycerol kinase